MCFEVAIIMQYTFSNNNPTDKPRIKDKEYIIRQLKENEEPYIIINFHS